jgi:hypothetical protein
VAQLWIDNDAGSNTNVASFLLMSPPGGFTGGLVTEVETFCFYDSSIWTPSLTPPAACTVDTTPPVTTASLSGPKGNNGWYRGAVVVTLSATDPDSPVAATYYSVDGSAQQTYSAPFSIAGDGVHQLSFYSIDPAGNQEKSQPTHD